MIKRIEIKNFESHKHTVLDFISGGLNLIRGESNSGKTSIVRALKLISQNDYDPKSVRVGESKCEVTVETDKGKVKVTRGPKVNIWEVTPIGRPCTIFDKVGTKVVPEAAKIIGLNVVKLGDVEIPVNIMDQLESHFMLASMGGQDASGSMRAQVIDEISGLSGIEGVIKDVSLDNHRLGREVTETEYKMEENRKQLHDETALQSEATILERAEKCLTDSESYSQAIIVSKSLLDEITTVSDNLIQAQDALAKIPDVNAAKKALDESNDMLVSAQYSTALLDEWNVLDADKQRVDSELALIPDTDTALGYLDEFEKFLVCIQSASELLEDWTATDSEIKTLDAEINAIPDTNTARSCLDNSLLHLNKATAMTKMLTEYKKVKNDAIALHKRLQKLNKAGDPSMAIEASMVALASHKKASELMSETGLARMRVKDAEKRVATQDAALKKVVKERDDLMASIKVCPLTLKPISQECLEAM